MAAAGVFAGLRWRAAVVPVTPPSIVDVRDEAAAAQSPPVVEPLRSAADSPSPAAAPASTQAAPVSDAPRARRACPHRRARADGGGRRPRPSPRPRRPPPREARRSAVPACPRARRQEARAQASDRAPRAAPPPRRREARARASVHRSIGSASDPNAAARTSGLARSVRRRLAGCRPVNIPFIDDRNLSA